MKRSTTALFAQATVCLAFLSGCAGGSPTVDSRGIQAPPLGAGGQESSAASPAPTTASASHSSSASATHTTTSKPTTTPPDQRSASPKCLASFSPIDGPGPRTGEASQIGGGLQVACPGVGEVRFFSVIFYLEWQSTGAAWHQEGRDFMTAPGDDRILYAGCKVGTWRFRVEISGSDAHGNPLTITPAVSQEQYISRCP